MSIVSLASENVGEQTVKKRAIEIHGAVDLSFVKDGADTGLGRLYYRDPMKVLFPRGDVKTAALVTTGGGLFGGDIYDIDVRLEEGAEALVSAQAAEKVYRSSGPDCHVNVNLDVANGASLEWLPQETILFDQARFRRNTKVNVAHGATALVGEILVFGRLASGEVIKQGLLREGWEIYRDDKLVWADALHIDGEFEKPLNHVSAFGGARAVATAVFVDDGADSLLEEARALLPDIEGVRVGVTLVNGLLVCRWLAADPYLLRQSFGRFWAEFRHKSLGRENRLPRLWHC